MVWTHPGSLSCTRRLLPWFLEHGSDHHGVGQRRNWRDSFLSRVVSYCSQHRAYFLGVGWLHTISLDLDCHKAEGLEKGELFRRVCTTSASTTHDGQCVWWLSKVVFGISTASRKWAKCNYLCSCGIWKWTEEAVPILIWTKWTQYARHGRHGDALGDR